MWHVSNKDGSQVGRAFPELLRALRRGERGVWYIHGDDGTVEIDEAACLTLAHQAAVAACRCTGDEAMVRAAQARRWRDINPRGDAGQRVDEYPADAVRAARAACLAAEDALANDPRDPPNPEVDRWWNSRLAAWAAQCAERAATLADVPSPMPDLEAMAIALLVKP